MVNHFTETMHSRPAGNRTGENDRLVAHEEPALRDNGCAGQENLPVYESHVLFGKMKEVGIVHEGALYRLKTTKQGKLVLNK